MMRRPAACPLIPLQFGDVSVALERWTNNDSERLARYETMYQWSAAADAFYTPAEIGEGQAVAAFGCGPGQPPAVLAQERANHAKSLIRARIEHVFGAQQSAPGGQIVRTIGIMRARAKIGLQNLAYNIRRLVTLERLAAA